MSHQEVVQVPAPAIAAEAAPVSCLGTRSADTMDAASSVECKPCGDPRKRAKKRENCMNWDDYFMSVAFLSAMRSKDPSTQVIFKDC